MSTSPRRGLFVQYDATRSGSPMVGAMVVQALTEGGWAIDAVFASPGPMTAVFADVGCSTHTLDHGHWLRGGSLARRARRLARDASAAGRFVGLMRSLRPRFVYVNTLMGVAAVAAARMLRIPCIWHLHEMFEDAGGEMRLPLGGKSLVRFAARRLPSRVVVVSTAVAQNVLGAGESPGRGTRGGLSQFSRSENGTVPFRSATVVSSPILDARDLSRVVVIPNAVEQPFFDDVRSAAECRELLGLPEAEKPLVGVPGTLRPVKGHEFFFDAAVRVHRAMPECRFAVTGDGPAGYRRQLDARVEAAGLREHVRFLGPLADMAAFYRACDVVCVPSRSETGPRTAIEAFACGTPLVATAVGGTVERVEHESTGLLVRYGEDEAMAGAIVRLLADRPGACRLARAAREEAWTHYREEPYRQRIRELIDELLGGPRT